MAKVWYHINSWASEPFTCYGIAANEEGKVVSAPDKYSWMIGRTIDFIKQFFENKPASIVEVMPKYENTSQDSDTEVVGDV